MFRSALQIEEEALKRQLCGVSLLGKMPTFHKQTL